MPGTNGFYVEFDVRLSDNDPDHFPAVWLMPAEHNGAQLDHYAADAAGFERWMELDIDEGGFGPGLTGTVHNWTGVYPDYQHVQNPSNVSSVAIDRSQKHTFGAGFDPVKQTVTWWLDGVRQMAAGPPHVPAIAARQHFYLIMSAQSHRKNKTYSMFVSAVRAYTSPTSALPEIDSRKPAETVKGDASPRGMAARAASELRLAGIFADGMVLQRGVIAPVWGWGSPGTKVTVEFAGQRQSGTVAGDGRWSVNLAPLAASSSGAELKVSSGGAVVVFTNVLVGEVWLCSGQSNIQRNLTECDNGRETVAGVGFPTIRFVIIPHDRAPERQDDFRVHPGSWHQVDSSNLTVSAVGFFFARRLQQNLGVPVGLIISAWEGSVITTWIPRDRLSGSLNDDKSAGLTFNAKINPLIPFAIKGVVWYQGEENHGMGMKYSDYLTATAQSWRQDWGRDLPFFIVMLAPYRYEGSDGRFVGEKGKLPVFWMAQIDAARRIKNAEVVCTIDVGDSADIHPRKKEPVGDRLALAVMKRCSGATNSSPGPVFNSVTFEGKAASAVFNNAAQGLRIDGSPTGFEIAGEDRKFALAKAVVSGKNSITITSEEVVEPRFVR